MNSQSWTNQNPLELVDRYVSQFPPGYILDKWYLLRILYPDDFENAVRCGLVLNDASTESIAEQPSSSYSHYSSIQNRSVSSTFDTSPVHNTNYPSPYISTFTEQAVNLSSSAYTSTTPTTSRFHETSLYASSVATTGQPSENAEAMAYPGTYWQPYQVPDSNPYMGDEVSAQTWSTPFARIWQNVATEVPQDFSLQELPQESEGGQPPTLHELQPLSTLDWAQCRYQGEASSTSTSTNLPLCSDIAYMPCISAEEVDEAIGETGS